jgi:methylmalonyl-CoA/ethylmalonyl-CoA epimerase
MVTNVHHVGIAVKSLEQAYRFWRDTLGLPVSREAEVREQGVRAALLAAGESEIELLEPLSPESAVGRFLAKRGPGLHHICFKTADVASDLTALRARGVPLIDTEPRQGLAGRIGFLHPKACHGVLVELATPSSDAVHAESPVRFKRLVIGSPIPDDTAKTYQDLFGLPEVEVNGGPRTMLGWAGGATLVAPDLPPLVSRLEKAQASVLLGAAELTVEPTSSHGVHLHISRYHFP